MNHTQLVEPDLFFRGSRPYIQGSLIISRAAQYVSRRGLAKHGLVVCEAKFQRILTRQATLSLAAPHLGSAAARIQFRGSDRTCDVYVNEAAGSPPARLADSAPVVTAVERDELSATARFDCGEPSLDGVLRAIVELQKHIIEAHVPGARAIMFVSLFDADIPAEDRECEASGRIAVTPLWQRPGTIISRVALEPDRKPRRQAKIAFQYLVDHDASGSTR